MKYISLIFWTFCLFLLMFSSFPLRVECRPSRVLLGPGPPSSSSLTTVSDTHHQNTCPFLEGPSIWPSNAQSNADIYPTDITLKVRSSELVLEGTARSRSEIREDGTFGVTFDLSRVVKGDAPILRRRKQFRIQFLDSPVNLVPAGNNNSSRNRSNSIYTGQTPSPQFVHSNHPRSINTVNNNINLSNNFTSRHYTIPQQPNRNSNIGITRNKKLTISNSLTAKSTFINSDGQYYLSGDGVKNLRCVPPKATIKTGRKYYVFVTKLDNHFIPVFSPELVNKKNAKILNSTFCHGCEQPPGVVAPKEVVLPLKQRLKLRCRLHKGFPVPTLVWYRDGKLINLGDSDSRYRLRAKRRQSILVIRKAKQSDIGLYKCEAKNYLGSAYATTRVILPKVTPPTTTVSTIIKEPVATTSRTLPPLTGSECPYDAFCLNGGTCTYYPSILEYVCQCAEGYKGQRCDVKDIPTSGSMYLSYFCTFGSINPHYPCSPSR